MLCCASTDQSLVDVVIIDSLKQVVTIISKHHLATFNHRQLLDYNFRRENVSLLNQLRGRNIAQNLTIDTPIHAWFGCSKRMFGCCCKEIATICVLCEILSCREEVTLNTIVCFIKIDVVHLNICLHNTMERMICSEDDNILTFCASSVSEYVNVICISCRIVVCFTTMNVHHMCMSCINQLKKFRAQLFCQQNTWSNNNRRHSVVNILTILHNILNHTDSFATTCRNNHLTFVIGEHTVENAFLMWTKGQGHSCSVDTNTIAHRDPPESASVPLVQSSASSCASSTFFATFGPFWTLPAS